MIPSTPVYSGDSIVPDDHYLAFKFHWLNDKGQATSMFRKKGNFDGEILTLENTEVPVATILHLAVRETKMALSYATGKERDPVSVLLIQPSSKKEAEQLKKILDISRSAVWAKQHQQALEKKGLGHIFRDAVCPQCDATLILSDMPVTPQVYCHFCDSLSTVDAESGPIKEEKDLRICEECGMYTRPQKFTILYIYILLVVNGFWQKETWRCPPCMRGDAWKMLFGNMLFLVGLPIAIVQLFRSYGGSSVGGRFKGLDTGNIKARKGDLAGAVASYRGILERVPVTAGVKYNLGVALLAQGNNEKAAGSFELALRDCANYAPAYRQLKAIYTRMGQTEKLKELERIWSSGESQAETNDEEQIFSAEEFE
jgi:Tetratricopeptide repeat